MKISMRKIAMAATVAAAAVAAVPAAHAGTTAQTKNPIVLVHGFIGFDNILGLVNYFYQIPGALEKEGAKVYVAHLNNSQTHEYRGEELIDQLEAWKVTGKHTKFNLLGHSMGGPTTRYVAAVRGDLVSSVVSISGVNLGSKVADYVFDHGFKEGDTLDSLGSFGLQAIAWLTGYKGNNDDTQAIVAADAMRRANAVAFNVKYPEGAPAVQGQPGNTERGTNGIYYYSVAGDKVKTNGWDLLDAILVGTETLGLKGTPNDGLVELESQYWGKHIKTYPWNHIDAINHLLGLIGEGAPSPKTAYVQWVQTLKSKGL